MTIYLASPFFNPEQSCVVEKIENLMSETGLQFYSPRKDGVLMNMTSEERKNSTKRIFNRNVQEISSSSLVLAVIDGRDIGTIWEIGYAYGSRIPIITFSNHGYGTNVMIKECVWAHVKGIDRLRDLLLIYKREPWRHAFEKFQDFSEDVT